MLLSVGQLDVTLYDHRPSSTSTVAPPGNIQPRLPSAPHLTLTGSTRVYSALASNGGTPLNNMYGSLSKNPSSKAVMSGLEPVRTPLGADLRICEMLSACFNQAESVSFLSFFFGKWENLHNFALD